MYLLEVQQEVIKNQVYQAETVPFRTSISRALNKDLGYSYKRLKKIARESLYPENELKLVEYSATCADKHRRTMYFFR